MCTWSILLPSTRAHFHTSNRSINSTSGLGLSYNPKVDVECGVSAAPCAAECGSAAAPQWPHNTADALPLPLHVSISEYTYISRLMLFDSHWLLLYNVLGRGSCVLKCNLCTNYTRFLWGRQTTVNMMELICKLYPPKIWQYTQNYNVYPKHWQTKYYFF